MPRPVLTTKLFIPPQPPNAVLRARLNERVCVGLQGKMTLISAPAGFGKTTLLSGWATSLGCPVAWLSLDEEHDDPERLLVYLVSALQTVAPGIGSDILTALQSQQPTTLDSSVTNLLNELSRAPQDLVLVLDDYHTLQSGAVNELVTFLLQHLPPTLHLVISTREEPRLPLARLRARGQLTEIHALDLRFTTVETAELLNQRMGLALSSKEIMALEDRTEGWIACLQLAALSLQGRRDTTGFINSFSGSHRFVLDYLVEEVLQQQSKSIHDFLLYTSVLERLCGSLCEAVLKQADGSGQETLEYIDRSNLLLIPLDDERRWYRYHHLFAEALQRRLSERYPNDVANLHSRACSWFVQNELLSEAIGHALGAKDFAQAADLIELARPKLERGTRDKTILGWVDALPDALVRDRPMLNLAYSWALLDAGKLEAAGERLEGIDPNSLTETTLIASLAIARVYHAKALGDGPGTVEYAQQALSFLAEDDHMRRSQVTGLLVLANWANGDVPRAQEVLLDARDLARKTGDALATIDGAFLAADLHLVLGQLQEAFLTYESALQLVAEHGDCNALGLENVYAGLGDLYRERNDLEAANRALETSKGVGQRLRQRVWDYRWCLAQAKLQEALGELEEALKFLNQATSVYIRSPLPNTRPLAALKARVWLKQGRLNAALAWAREHGLSVDDELSYLREFEHMTLVRLQIHRSRSDKVSQHLGLLERLLQAAEASGRQGSVLEILVLQSLAHEARADIPSALIPLRRALAMAEPEGYVRLFVDEGKAMAKLLRAVIEVETNSEYPARLLAALTDDMPSLTQKLMDPLTSRELDVLRLLKTELSGPEIAQELIVSLSTIRTHTKRIYRKLGVSNRRSAVQRALELALI